MASAGSKSQLYIAKEIVAAAARKQVAPVQPVGSAIKFARIVNAVFCTRLGLSTLTRIMYHDHDLTSSVKSDRHVTVYHGSRFFYTAVANISC